MERKLWEARGVNVYDGLTLDQFLAELEKQQGNGGDGSGSGGNQR